MLVMDEKARRFANKRFNERLKLLANAINGAAIVTIGVAVVSPAVGGAVTLALPMWIIIAVVLHFIGQAVLGLLRDKG